MASCRSAQEEAMWETRVPGKFYLRNSTVVADADSYYIGLDVGQVLALKKSTGAVKWQSQIEAENISSQGATAKWLAGLWLLDDRLYVVYDHRLVNEVDRYSGRIVHRWILPQRGSRYLAYPHFTPQGIVVLGSDEGVVSAFSLLTGDLAWSISWGTDNNDKWAIPVSVSSRGILCIGSPIAGESEGGTFLFRETPIRYLSPGTGKVIWETRAEQFGVTSEGPELGKDYFNMTKVFERSGKLFFQIKQELYAVSTYTGSVVWKQSLPDSLQALETTNERVLVVVGSGMSFSLVVLDAQTGVQVSNVEKLPGIETPFIRRIAIENSHILIWYTDSSTEVSHTTNLYKIDIETGYPSLVRTLHEDVVHFARDGSILSSKIEGDETLLRLWQE